MSKKRNEQRIKMPLWYLAKQVSINWSTKIETPDRRPLGEFFRGFFAEIGWAIVVILGLILITTSIWLVAQI